MELGRESPDADPGFLDRGRRGGGGRDRREPKTFLQDHYKREKGADCAHTALCIVKPPFLLFLDQVNVHTT